MMIIFIRILFEFKIWVGVIRMLNGEEAGICRKINRNSVFGKSNSELVFLFFFLLDLKV